MTASPTSPCVHYRSTIRHDTCAAGVRYASISGADRDGCAKPGLSCWFDEGTLTACGAMRQPCAMKETA